MSSQENQSSSTARHGSFRSGFAFGVLSFAVIGVVGVVMTVLTSRIYGVRIIGQFALISAPIAVLWVISTAKEQAGLIKEVTGLPPRHPRVTQLFSAVFTFSWILTSAMSLASMVILWFLFHGPLHRPALAIPAIVNVAGYAVVTNTAWNFDAIFSAFVAGRQLFFVRLHEALSTLVIASVVGITWHSVWGLVVASIGGSATALIQRLVVVRSFVRFRLTLDEYREGMTALPSLLRFGIKITPGAIAQGVSQSAGVWVLAVLGYRLSSVGAYSRAQSVPERLQQVNTRIVEVLYPTLVGRLSRGDGKGFDRALIDSIRYALVGTLLIAAVFGGSAHLILRVFGPGFDRATPALALLMLYPALTAITVTQDQAFFAVGRPGLTSVIATTRLGVTIALTIALTPAIGITGPALALLAGSAVQVFWGVIAMRPFLTDPLRATWPIRRRVPLLVSYTCGFAASFAVEHAIPAIGGLLVSLPAGTIAYVAALVLSGGLNDRDRQRIAELLEVARSRRLARSAPSTA